jgi:hypothetical protein
MTPPTVVVTVRAGEFLVRDGFGASGGHSGQGLAAALAALPLYGSDLRLWLHWPADRTACERLHGNLAMLAEATGATVWVPPPGGSAAVVDGGAELAARDQAGKARPWQAYRPPGVDGATPYPSAPVGDPALAYVERAGRPHGVGWLPDRIPVNAEPLVLHAGSAWPPQRVAREGVPTAELFVLADALPRPAADRHLLRLRVEPGGAVPMSSMLTHAPPAVRRRTTGVGTYLLPAGWLDRARLEGAFRLAGTPLVLRSTHARHGADGIPEDIPRWPAANVTAEVFAIVPDAVPDQLPDLVPLHPRLPATAPPGSRALRLRVDGGTGGGPAIDVAAGTDRLAPLTSVRSRLAELRADGVEVVLPREAFGRVSATGLYDIENDKWLERPCPASLPVAALLAGTGRHSPAP